MRLRSRGLGRKELVMDFREYEVAQVDDELVVIGTIRDPVNWDFTIRVCEDDLPGLIHLALRPKMLGLVLRSIFKRKKKSHWGEDRTAHIEEGVRRLGVARESAQEKAEACMEQLTVRKPARAARATRPSGQPRLAARVSAAGAGEG